MAYSTTICLALFISVFITAGSELITFNPEAEDLEENTDALLKLEQFISVQKKSSPYKSASASAPVPPHSQKSPISSPSHNTALEVRKPEGKGRIYPSNLSAEHAQSGSSVGTSRWSNSISVTDQDGGGGGGGGRDSGGSSGNKSFKPGGFEPLPQESEWQELFVPRKYDDWEDLLDAPNEFDEDLLTRFRREVGCGEVGDKIQVTIVGATLTAAQAIDGSAENKALKNEVDTAITASLRQETRNNDVRSDTISISRGSIIVESDIYYLEGELTVGDLAQAFHNLDEKDAFVLNGQSYALSKPQLEPSPGDAMRPAICFLCKSYQTCTEFGDGTGTCELSDTRFYSFGSTVGDSSLTKDNGFVFATVLFDAEMPYDRNLRDRLFISVNGLVSFKQPFTNFEPVNLPVGGRELLAPYWTDLQLASNDPAANVFYQRYSRSSGNTVEQNAIMTKANEHVVQYASDVTNSFRASTVVVITWDNVPSSRSSSMRISVQCVVISDGQNSYGMYLYGNGAMMFDPNENIPVVVGWGSSNFDNTMLNYYSFDRIIGSTNEIGRWFFKFGALPNSFALCRNFFRNEMYSYFDIQIANWRLPRCPCNVLLAFFSNLWLPSFEELGCFDLIPINFYGFYGRRCCYRFDGSLAIENRRPRAGSLQKYNAYQFFFAALHYEFDTQPKRWCCVESNLCRLYYFVRPQNFCTNRRARMFWMLGDPHITTLDQHPYIFNGWGEYMLLKIEGTTPSNHTVNFVMQARTCRALQSDGSATDATVWCAISLTCTNGDSAHVEIHSSGTYMVIYVNGEDFTWRFRDDPSFKTMDSIMYIQKVNASLRLTTPDRVAITVTLDTQNKLLDINPIVDDDYQGMTVGLVGNFNGDPSDDYVMPNGTIMPNSSSEQDIFNYGQLWAVTNENSVFRYREGENTATFSNYTFVPLFLDQANATLRAEAEAVCGETNIPCIYDFIATRNRQLALSTKQAVETFDEEEARLANEAPTLSNSTLRINAKVNETIAFDVTASDPENSNVQFVFIDKPGESTFTYQVSGTQLNANFTPADKNPVSIQVAAQDINGLQSEILQVEVVVCSQCNNHGTCDFEDIRYPENSTEFALATCICDGPYDGTDCESDKDGCLNQPCPHLTNCTDVGASVEINTGKAYNCSQCPDGLLLTTDGTKCEDVNECTDTNICPSNSDCINAHGSYSCICKSGFRKSSSGTCVDINECVEKSYQCEQICVNEVGAYSCACESGFELVGLAVFKYKCNKTADPCDGLQAPNCEYGCRNNSGSAECFCSAGHELTSDNITCDDVNECNENLCSQDCNNIIGSYTCSCYVGFILGSDGLSCEPCPLNKYGEDCKQTCECRGRATRCDSQRGCICNEQWTGTDCEIDVDECLTDNICPFKNCRNLNGSYICECPTGFDDANGYGNCTDIDECDDPSVHRCPELSVCQNNPGSFACVCSLGFNLINNTCQDIDECDTGISGCQQTCVNQVGSYNCECGPGFVLADDRLNCIKEEDVCRDFNLTCSYACRVENSVPECYCQKGYMLNGDQFTCLDVNECNDVDINKCEQDCVNIPGSYTCSCPIGKELRNDERTCQACDEYHWGEDCNNMCSCNPMGTDRCDSVLGCQCLSGWQGATCHNDKNECEASTSPCPNLADCINTAGSFSCRCRNGYQEQGNECVDIDECRNNVCDQTCSNTIGSFICTCFEGFRLNGDNCEDIDECEISALNGCDQRCRNTIGGFTCECFDGYQLNTLTRNTCYLLNPTDECSQQNNCSDICVLVDGLDVCNCPPGFQLENNVTCTDINECLTTHCTRGTCSNSPAGSFTCSCDPGFKLASDQVTCQECEYFTYGVTCAKDCACNRTTTDRCLANNGTCVCATGWEGTNCNSDVDECTANTHNCPANSNCVNDPGTFRCVCNVGFFRSEDRCEVCDATHYGQDCSQECTCNMENTQDCVDTNGTCICDSGWQGENCTENIDECRENAPYCTGPFETCNDLDGSVECLCVTGYTRPDIGSNCSDCDPIHYGDNCAKECSCVFANTADCNNVNGSCACKSGWSGSNCETDIDECLGNYCTGQHEVCVNLNGSARCDCQSGYEKNSSNICEDCDSIYYGDNCASDCSCVFANTDDCNNVDGSCACKSGWSGSNCETDIDECLGNYCTGQHEVCVNLNGKARCDCQSGYEKNSSNICEDINECLNPTKNTCVTPQVCRNSQGNFTCRGDIAVYEIKITIGYTRSQYDPKIFDNMTSEYRDFRGRIENAVLQFGVNKIGPQIDSVSLPWIREGSVIVEGDTQIDTTLTKNPQGDAARLAYTLYQEGSLTVDGTAFDVAAVSSGGREVTSSTSLCEVHNVLKRCSSGTECAVENGTPVCKAVDSDSDNELIVGLGVGIPLFVLLTVVIAVLVYMYVRSKKEKETESTPSVDRDASFRSVFATQVATKGSWGAPARFQMYSPDTYSEAATSNSSGDGQLLKARQKGRSDFQESPWYDNRGAGVSTPRDAAESRGAPTEAGAPTSNFSWEYMFRLLEPHREFEIQRPTLSPAPNPMYTPRGGRNPDSLA